MYTFDDIIGNSIGINKIKDLGEKVCDSISPILIYGTTGTGKELMVQAIHSKSRRCKEPFIAQNCAAIPENLIESIFFGASKGGYTSAVDTKGLFEMAKGGTIYLDELNSMSVDFQGKILRVIQEGEYRRVGETLIRKNKARIIASVNEEPELLIRENRLRKDLYYRLNVIRINMPDLNSRKEDIPLLIKHFINKHNKQLGTNVNGIDESALKVLVKRTYEGNVRELEHIIEGALNYKSSGMIELKDMDIRYKEEGISLKEKLEQVEKNYIREALIICNYNVSKASKFLEVPRQTLQYKINKHGLSNLMKEVKNIK